MGKYSEAENSAIVEKRAQGMSWADIAKDLGRSHKAVQLHYYKIKGRMGIRRGRPTGSKTKKPRAILAPVMAPVSVTKKPMIAFVGEHSDITAAIKELFSE
jgi:transposase